jgi:hypothetical protein
VIRKIVSVLALLTAWASFGLVVQTLLSREQERCQRFGDLSAECFAPFAQVFVAISILFLLATLTLAVFAMRPFPRSGSN